MAEGQVLLDGPARETLSQTEVLAKTYVEPPQLLRLAFELEDGGKATHGRGVHHCPIRGITIRHKLFVYSVQSWEFTS